MKFTLLDTIVEVDDEGLVKTTAPQKDSTRGSVQCLCGRFAKYLGGRSYYNGTFDCYSFDVDCSRCGVVTVECV